MAMLWDAHSIVSMAPRLFDGRLADFNLGTADGASCDRELAARLLRALRRNGAYTAVLDSRFKGGYITRRYGRPAERVHAVQLEMAQSTYMNESPPYTFAHEAAERVRPLLREQLEIMRAWASTTAAAAR